MMTVDSGLLFWATL